MINVRFRLLMLRIAKHIQRIDNINIHNSDASTVFCLHFAL